MKDLIDRQETLKEIKELANLYPYKVIGDRESYSTYNEAWSDCADMAESAVLNQLTVEAIPIGYIENRIAELTVLITEHGDFIEYDEMVKVWIHEANSLERLLKKWRERKEE